MKEETGLEVNKIEFIMWQEFVFGPQFSKRKHFIFLNFSCQIVHSNPTLDGREAIDYIWIKLDEAVKRIDIEPYTKNTIKKYLEKPLD